MIGLSLSLAAWEGYFDHHSYFLAALKTFALFLFLLDGFELFLMVCGNGGGLDQYTMAWIWESGMI